MHGSHCYSLDTDGVLTCGWPEAHRDDLVRDVPPVYLHAPWAQRRDDTRLTDWWLTDWSDIDRCACDDWSDHRRYEADWR